MDNTVIPVKQRSVVGVALLLLTLLWSPMSFSVACGAVFTNGVQSHSEAGSVSLNYGTEISGGNSVLDTPSLSEGGQVTCAGGSCLASGYPAASSTVAFITGSGSDGAVSGGGTKNVPEGDYRSVSVNQQRRLRFTDSGAQYLMEGLSTNYQSTLQFNPGDYWIDGNFRIGQETVVELLSAGTVRIFVNGDVNIEYKVDTSSINAENLLIYATGNVSLANEVRLNAFVYAAGSYSSTYQASVSGAVSGRDVTLANENEVVYQGDVLANVDFSPFCDAGTTSTSLQRYWRMDELEWNGTSGEVLDVSGNDAHGTAQSGAQTDSASAAIAGDPGTCRYGELDGSNDYIQTPDLSQTLNGNASLSFWVRTTQTGNDTGWQAPGVAGVEQSGGTNDIFWGWLDASGRIGISVGNDYSTKSQDPINDGGWHHVVLSRDTDAGRYEIYIDGSLNASGSISTATVTTPYSSLGRIEDTGGSPEYLAGNLDEVRVYSGILEASEVSAIYGETHPCVTPICPTGSPAPGLLGEYFDNQNLSGDPSARQSDAPIQFSWENNEGPSTLGGRDNDFSMRWQGRLFVTQPGAYRFRTRSDDGVRLWVDGQQVIDRWNDHAVTEDTSSPVRLEAGDAYDVTLEFYENGGRAEIELQWQTPGGGGYVPIPGGNAAATDAGLYHCPGDTVAGYTLEFMGPGVTCEAVPITITARDSTGAAMDPPAGTEIELTSPAADWFGGHTYVFSGNESFVVRYLRYAGERSVNLAVTDGTAGGTAGPLEFRDAGLIFYANRSGGLLPNQVAAVHDPNPVIRAVKTDADTDGQPGACVARVENQTSFVDIAFQCQNPTSCTGQPFTVDDKDGDSIVIQGNDSDASFSYSSVELVFDDQGYASIPFQFDDVGQVQLFAELTIPADGPEPEATLNGSSNPFVVKPYTLAVSSVESATGSTNPETRGSGSGFVASGEAFTVNVEAHNAVGDITTNFGNELTPENVRLELTNLVYPAGLQLGSLTGADSLGASNGTAQTQTAAWDNVGTITVTPRLSGDSYLTGGDLVEYTESGDIGRFYPYSFALSSGSVSNACGGFSYMGQSGLALAYTLQARNLAGSVVTNYHQPDYAGTAMVNPVLEDSDGADGTSLSGRLQALPGEWVSGARVVDDPAAAFLRASDTAPDGPYGNLRIGLRLTDSLDDRALSDLDMNANTSGDCVAADNCNAVALTGSLDARFGRLHLESAFGPEVLDLPAPFYIEYWNGTEFIRNADDSCTRIPRGAITYEPTGTLADDGNRTVPIGSGTTTGQYDNLDAVGVNINNSYSGQTFTAPGEGNTGSFDILVNLTDRPWLIFDWNQDGNHNNDIQMPPASVGFGSYRGHDRIIYWREVLE